MLKTTELIGSNRWNPIYFNDLMSRFCVAFPPDLQINVIEKSQRKCRAALRTHSEAWNKTLNNHRPPGDLEGGHHGKLSGLSVIAGCCAPLHTQTHTRLPTPGEKKKNIRVCSPRQEKKKKVPGTYDCTDCKCHRHGAPPALSCTTLTGDCLPLYRISLSLSLFHLSILLSPLWTCLRPSPLQHRLISLLHYKSSPQSLYLTLFPSHCLFYR